MTRNDYTPTTPSAKSVRMFRGASFTLTDTDDVWRLTFRTDGMPELSRLTTDEQIGPYRQVVADLRNEENR